MDEFIKLRRSNWKESYIKKINRSKNSDEAIFQLISEYIYYSSKTRELKRRIRIVIQSIKSQMINIPHTRKDIDKEYLDKTKKELAYFKKKLKG